MTPNVGGTNQLLVQQKIVSGEHYLHAIQAIAGGLHLLRAKKV